MNQTLNQQLHNLLLKLHKLGQELPQILLYLTQIAQPKLPQNLIIPFLGQMFEKIPPLLSKLEPQKLADLIKDPPAEAVPLRILIDLSSIQQLLQQISVLQLLHLTNNTIPPGSQELQEAFLRKVIINTIYYLLRYFSYLSFLSFFLNAVVYCVSFFFINRYKKRFSLGLSKPSRDITRPFQKRRSI